MSTAALPEPVVAGRTSNVQRGRGGDAWWRLSSAGLFALCVAVVAVWRVLQPLDDPDLWWHVVAGRLVLEERHFPTTDPFSFTVQGQPWLDHGWLSGAVMWLVWRAGGWVALQALFAGCMLLALGSVYWRLRRSGSGVTAAACATAGALLIAGPAMRPTPMLFGVVGAVLCLCCFEAWRLSRRPWLLAALPLIVVAWTNLHASFISGWLIALAHVVGLSVRAPWWSDRLGAAPGRDGAAAGWSLDARAARPLLLAGAGMLLAPLLNVYGLRLVTYTLEAGSLPFNRAYVAEWRAPSLGEPAFVPLWVALVLLLAVGWRARRAGTLDGPGLLLALGFAGASLVSAQALWPAALSVPPFLVRTATALRGAPAHSPRPPAGTRLALAHWAALAGIALLFLPRAYLACTPATFARIEAQEFPARAVEVVLERRLPGPLFNSYNWGGYLIWRLWPAIPVFVDGRAELYGDAFLQRYRRVYLGLEDWHALFDHYGVRLAILEVDNPLAARLRAEPAWSEVYADRLAAVFARSGGV